MRSCRRSGTPCVSSVTGRWRMPCCGRYWRRDATPPPPITTSPQRIFVLQSPEAMAKADACMGCHFHPPVLLAVAYDPAAAWDRECDGKNHGEIDATIAVTQMMLQAADLGLGTTYVGMFDPEKLTAAFPEMAGLVPIAMLPLGYPAEGAHPARLHTDRKPMEQLVKYL